MADCPAPRRGFLRAVNLGQQHFTAQFAAGAIAGSLAFSGMRYVTFNYTNTDFGFDGIDDLSFEPAVAAEVPEPGVAGLLGGGLLVLTRRLRRGRRR